MPSQPDKELAEYIEHHLLQFPEFQKLQAMILERIDGLTRGVMADRDDPKLFEKGEVAGLAWAMALPINIHNKHLSTVEDT